MLLVFLLVIMWSITLLAPEKEYFNDGVNVGDVFEDPVDIYDDFYARVYDKLFSTQERISFEKASLKENVFNSFSKPETKIADLCCGTSPHSRWLTEDGYDVVGADTSEAMLRRARVQNPSAKFYRLDITNPSSFPPKQLSHALLFYFSIYQFRNPKIVVDNIYQWLKPGGWFVVHLVDPNKFDPILAAASPFPAFSVQKYSKDRVTDSDVFFNDFKYRAKFIKGAHDDNAIFEETFDFTDKKKSREHKHRLLMPSVKDMIDTIRSSGFTYKESVDMTSVGYEYQYLVYFTK